MSQWKDCIFALTLFSSCEVVLSQRGIYYLYLVIIRGICAIVHNGQLLLSIATSISSKYLIQQYLFFLLLTYYFPIELGWRFSQMLFPPNSPECCLLPKRLWIENGMNDIIHEIHWYPLFNAPNFLGI